eukprot:863465-Ditylum_brightwellii.AAC.1
MEKETKKTGKDKQQTCTGPRFQPPTSGRPDWKIVHSKVIYWCNVCGYWNLTHFIKKADGVNIEGYFDNAMVNGHQCGIGKHSKTSVSGTKGAMSETQPAGQ